MSPAPPSVSWLRIKPAPIVALSHRDLGERFFFAEGVSELLFTENETNTERLVGKAQSLPLRERRHRQLYRSR